MAPPVLWVRRELRLGDHLAFHEAARRGGPDGAVPLFIVDEALRRYAESRDGYRAGS